jgi:hypothetical protein
VNRHRAWIVSAVALIVLPLVPGLDSNFSRTLLTQMGIAAVFALSYNLLLGQTGLLSFGHAVYFGLGGYASIHLMKAINAGLPIPMAFVPLAGALTGLAFGIVFGSLTTRRAGDDLRADFARHRRAGPLGVPDAARVLRRRGRREREPAPRRRIGSGSTSARSCRSTT